MKRRHVILFPALSFLLISCYCSYQPCSAKTCNCSPSSCLEGDGSFFGDCISCTCSIIGCTLNLVTLGCFESIFADGVYCYESGCLMNYSNCFDVGCNCLPYCLTDCEDVSGCMDHYFCGDFDCNQSRVEGCNEAGSKNRYSFSKEYYAISIEESDYTISKKQISASKQDGAFYINLSAYLDINSNERNDYLYNGTIQLKAMIDSTCVASYSYNYETISYTRLVESNNIAVKEDVYVMATNNQLDLLVEVTGEKHHYYN